MLHLLRVYGKSLESSQWPPAHRPLLAAEYSRRKKKVWYQGAALLIQRRGIKNSQAKIPGSLEYSGWRRIRTALAYDRKTPERICSGVVVDGEGFEPLWRMTAKLPGENTWSSSGWRRIRTFEGIASRFTVCPLWPLGNPSVNEFIIYKEESFCKIFFQLFWIFCVPERV